jgi:hypothetical protein
MAGGDSRDKVHLKIARGMKRVYQGESIEENLTPRSLKTFTENLI